MNHQSVMLLVLVVGMLCGVSIADDAGSLSVARAIQLVNEPYDGGDFNDNSGPMLQARQRLVRLDKSLYKYKPADANAWLACMRNKKYSMYGRLCAAYFLLDQNDEARDFVASKTKTKNLRHRYSAAEIVMLYVNCDSGKQWGIDTLIELLADGSLDGSGVESSPPGEYPQHDGDDILLTPIDDICWDLGFMEEKKAVPALISVLERRPFTGGAAFALGKIGDQRAIPVLMKVLKDRSGYLNREITALGELKCLEAVPILISRLGNPETTFGGLDILETEAILNALADIGDRSAIEPIQKYLRGDYPEECKAVARRVLMQIESADPVKSLLDLLDQETDESQRNDIISALAKYHDDRVVKRLDDIARTSDSASSRRAAIFALRDIGDRRALVTLASMLDFPWPKNMKLGAGGWKTTDFPNYFPEIIQASLRECTHQDFGKDASRWKDWIERNVGPDGSLPRK